MNTQIYPTDLTDAQGDHLTDLIPNAKPGGRPREVDVRMVINALLYVIVGGIKWRRLPREYPKWKPVYHSFRAWTTSGDWQRIHDTLRAQVRQQAGRHKHPRAGCLDSQSVKTTEMEGVRGYDAGKKIQGRKRHLLVDTMGLLLVVVVTAASVTKPAGARQVFNRLGGVCKKLRLVRVDGGNRGKLIEWAASHLWVTLLPVLRPADQKGFALLPHRWIVERTFAWLNQYRRLSKDYEVLPSSSEAMSYIAMTRLLLRRLKAA